MTNLGITGRENSAECQIACLKQMSNLKQTDNLSTAYDIVSSNVDRLFYLVKLSLLFSFQVCREVLAIQFYQTIGTQSSVECGFYEKIPKLQYSA